VEVVTVLDPSEKHAFDGMVTRLRADDPQFVHRIDRLGRPRRRLRRVLAILLWTLAPFCVVYGGWTGFFMAVAAAGYGAHLMTRRTGMADGAGGFTWWSSPGHRPGASI
jgi:Protein of unknown function (DUF3040)